jgi:hypothetical protein
VEACVDRLAICGDCCVEMAEADLGVADNDLKSANSGIARA